MVHDGLTGDTTCDDYLMIAMLLYSWSRAALAACMLFHIAPAAGPKLGWSIHLEKV
jgi:hypothetical protein